MKSWRFLENHKIVYVPGELVPANTTRSSDREYENRLINKTIFRFGRDMFLPSYLRMLWTAYRTLHYFKEAVKKLWLKKLSVEVLDGAAITASLCTYDGKVGRYV